MIAISVQEPLRLHLHIYTWRFVYLKVFLFSGEVGAEVYVVMSLERSKIACWWFQDARALEINCTCCTSKFCVVVGSGRLHRLTYCTDAFCTERATPD